MIEIPVRKGFYELLCEFDDRTDNLRHDEVMAAIYDAHKFGHYYTISFNDDLASYVFKVWIRRFGLYLETEYYHKQAYMRSFYRVTETLKEYLEELAKMRRLELEEELAELV